MPVILALRRLRQEDHDRLSWAIKTNEALENLGFFCSLLCGLKLM